jgi:hypothetical protein
MRAAAGQRGGMLAAAMELLAGSILPRVEDPWPDAIGLELPFVLAGAFGVIARVIHAEAPERRRDKAIGKAGVGGFWCGALLYLISLVVQVASS